MNLCIIVALGTDRAIGRAGNLAFHIREDLRHFKQLTLGHPVIMGRKTFESLPNGALPGRRNIVVTRNPAFHAPDIETAASLDEALALVTSAPKVFIIGGASVYAEALPKADTLHLTIIDSDCPDADTFFPQWDSESWEPCGESSAATDPASGLSYRFADFIRRTSHAATNS